MEQAVNVTTALDNVVWHAASERQSGLARREGDAVRFDPEVSPFAAVADLHDGGAWADLARLVGPGKGTVLFAPSINARAIDVPTGWSKDATIPCLQMVADGATVTAPGVDLVELGPQDVDDMLELVDQTRPGPFSRRTIELGTYLGLREDGRLVAMAGERFKVAGYTEISAVCTAPTHHRRGLGVATVMAVLERIRRRGEEAFLHVVTDNTSAIALYRKLGFTVRTEAEAVIVRNVGPDTSEA